MTGSIHAISRPNHGQEAEDGNFQLMLSTGSVETAWLNGRASRSSSRLTLIFIWVNPSPPHLAKEESSLEIIYESKETFTLLEPVPAAMTALESNLRNAGYRPQSRGGSVTVATGSDLLTRLWGMLLPWGRKSVPVGMTVSFTSGPMGTVASVHAYDRLGWYVDAKTNSVLKEEVMQRIDALIEVARRSLQR
ncbi:hypothetical protein QNO00_10225 [Arthrobacter sp. zg-Y1219]|uniref:hypothetical protein n=1 Tax=Arthrobacter sp. zg-Y1219 TaxID=3049067 RepID=UPI0024C430CB|nr:hypothetical protein [Arthrobacter sp. zg-Y1219]MDK1360639.1 hypothetical protein [Arthrobacter sp. zg-Y1219]